MDYAEMVHIAHYIASCAGGKVVEVGVGYRLEVCELLTQMGVEVVPTDLHPSSCEVVRDDILSPSPSVYAGVSLVYSLRPPPELWTPIALTAAKVGAQLIIRPFSTEYTDLSAIYRKEQIVSANGVRVVHFTHPKRIYRTDVCSDI